MEEDLNRKENRNLEKKIKDFLDDFSWEHLIPGHVLYLISQSDECVLNRRKPKTEIYGKVYAAYHLVTIGLLVAAVEIPVLLYVDYLLKK